MHAALAIASLAAASVLAAPAAGGPSTAFTVAVYPDTQNMTERFPDLYDAMSRWVVDNAAARRIAFVSHVGDIVNRDELAQWARARASHDILSAAGIPQGLAIGNHDYEGYDAPPLLGRNYLDHFGPDALYDFTDPASGAWQDQPWWGGSSPTGLSSYQLPDPATTAGLPLLFLNIEYELRASEVEWARGVVAQHPSRVVIVNTHSYVYDVRALRGRRGPFIHGLLGGLGPEGVGAHGLFERVVAAFPNVFMVLCGHMDSEHRRVSINAAGLPVHEIIQDFQTFTPNGGDAWMKLYEFEPALGEVRVSAYSPTVDGGRQRTRADQVRAELAALAGFQPEIEPAFRSIPDLVAGQPPLVVQLFTALLSTPGSATAILGAIQARDPFLVSTIAGALGQTPEEFEATLDAFPFEDVTPSLVAFYDAQAPVLGPIIAAGDFDAFIDFLTENDGARIEQALLNTGQDDTAFTLAGVDFAAYIGRFPCQAGIAGLAPCSAADVVGCGAVDVNDIVEWVNAYVRGDARADTHPRDGTLDMNDVIRFANAVADGCP